MATSYRLVSGTAPRDLGLGHLMRWGNVSYFVEGSPGPKRHFSGRTRWVGRSGAGGDLLFRGPPNMWVQFATRVPGFQGAVLALDRPGVAVEKTYAFERELSFETIPGALPAEPRVKPAKVLVKVRDELGRPIPAKIRFDRAESSEPIFPDNGGLEGVDRFCWTGNGSLECDVPPGKYRALVTSGIERDAKRFKFEATPGSTRVLKADLPRVVPTPGWISGDLHLHQAPSVDADISLENRVVSIAAEGVEFAVATDHYVVTDFSPIVRELQDQGVLAAPVATMIGTEISTLGNRFGHFNVFPLDLGENVKYRDVTPSELFADARLKSPDGVLQVNHPRWDGKLGYFTRYGLTLDTAEPKVAGYDPNFDTLEVYNGDDARDLNLVIPVLLDWMHLLGRGHRYTATGNSDSHNLAFLDPGLPRTYIRHGAGTSDETDVQAPPGDIVRALKAGHVVVTSGPFIDASVGDKGPGETAAGTGPKAELKVRVRAAPWISVSRLEVFEGGNARLIKSVRIYPNAKPLRYEATIDGAGIEADLRDRGGAGGRCRCPTPPASRRCPLRSRTRSGSNREAGYRRSPKVPRWGGTREFTSILAGGRPTLRAPPGCPCRAWPAFWSPGETPRPGSPPRRSRERPRAPRSTAARRRRWNRRDRRRGRTGSGPDRALLAAARVRAESRSGRAASRPAPCR